MYLAAKYSPEYKIFRETNALLKSNCSKLKWDPKKFSDYRSENLRFLIQITHFHIFVFSYLLTFSILVVEISNWHFN